MEACGFATLELLSTSVHLEINEANLRKHNSEDDKMMRHIGPFFFFTCLSGTSVLLEGL